jgi:hypothetical protein
MYERELLTGSKELVMSRTAKCLSLLFSLFTVVGVSYGQASNTWQSAGQMTRARTGAVAILMQDGRILITGGMDANGVPLTSAEFFNPASEAFSAAPAMNVPRANHAAIVLTTGDVLVTGGVTDAGGDYTDTAELFSVITQQWTELPSTLPQGVAGHAMALLADGNVLIAGGASTTGPLGALLLFNAAENSITSGGTLQTARTNAAAAAMPDGRVLITGGTDINNNILSSTEIFVYSPSTLSGTVSAGPALTYPRTAATATSTYDGVAVVGGYNIQNGTQADLGTAEIFSQWTNAFRAVNGATPRSSHFAVRLPNNGAILAMGGTGGQAVDLLEPWANGTAGAFVAAANSLINPTGGFAVPVTLGSILAASGEGTAAGAAELYWFATIATDQPDYAPGTPVVMNGTGFQPGETVDLHLHEWVNQTVTDVPDYTVLVGTNGTFSFTDYAPTPSDLGARYHLTAIGETSALQAQTVFTDATATSTVISSGTNPSNSGASVTFTATVTYCNGGSGQTCSGGTVTAVTVGTLTFKTGTNSNCTGSGSATLASNVSLNGSGQATDITSFTNPPSSINVCAIYSGFGSGSSAFSGSNNFVTQSVSSTDATSTAITSSSVTYGQTAASIVTVTNLGGTSSPTGNVSMAVTGGGLATCTHVSSATSTSTFSCTINYSAKGVAGSPYTLTATFSHTGNFADSGNTGTLTVNPAPLTAAVSGSQTYGGTDKTFTPAYSGFVNNETAGVVSGALSCSTNAVATSPVGSSYSVSSCSGLTAANYAIIYSYSGFTVNPASLTITVTGSQTYGGTNQLFTPTYAGFVNSEGPGILSGTLTCGSTATATSSVAGNPYKTSGCSGLTAANYTISYSYGSFTVNPKPLSITASSSSFTYGGTVPNITPTLTAGNTFVGADSFASLVGLSCATTATSTSHVAGNPYSTSCSGSTDSDYTISYVNGTVNVNPKPLSITASSSSLTYGETAPTITPNLTAGSAFVGSDSFASLVGLTCSTTATSTSHVAGNPYPSSCVGSTDGDYTVSYVNGIVNVNPKPLSVTASSSSFTYGGTVPTITPTLTAGNTFIGTDSFTNLVGLTCSTTATSASHVGGNPYPSSCSGGTDSDYSITYVPGAATVIAAPLSITASSGSFSYGSAPPNITPTLTAGSSFVNSDSFASLVGLTCSTTATNASHVASSPYSSSCSGSSDSDYSIAYVPGAVTVIAAPLGITAGSGSFTYGSAPPNITPTLTAGSSFVNGDSFASLVGLTCSTTATSTSHVAGNPYPSSCSGGTDSDYSISYVNGSVNVNPRSATLTAGSLAAITYEGNTHALSACTSSDSTFVTCANSPAGLIGPDVTSGVQTVTPSPSYVQGDAGDYTITSNNGSYEIDKLAVTLTAGSYGPAAYDGSTHNISACTSSASTFVTCSNTATTVGPDVTSGAVTLTPNYVQGNAGDYTITSNSGSYEIDKLPVTLTAGNYGPAAYDGSMHALSACSSSSGLLSCTNNPAGPVGPNVGGTAVAPIAVYGSASAGDFAITSNDGSWSITPASVRPTAGSLNGTYNGSAQYVSACVVTGNYTGSVTCTNNPAFEANAGNGTVTPVVSYGTDASTNYSLNPVNGTWSIAKATPTLSLTCTEVIYDGNPHSCVGTATGVGGAAVSGTWSYNPASETNPGSYTITGSFTSTDTNYVSGSTASGTLKIDHWTVTGFYSPVVPTTGTVVWNVIKGGSTVPLKFNIYAGTVQQTSTRAVQGGTVMVYPANCNVGGWANTATDILVDTGATALRYDTTGLQFIQNWKTPKGSGCYVAQMTAADGTSILAYFTAN